jgi:hypothetical protein
VLWAHSLLQAVAGRCCSVLCLTHTFVHDVCLGGTAVVLREYIWRDLLVSLQVCVHLSTPGLSCHEFLLPSQASQLLKDTLRA